MKKVTKILLPIASTVVVAAPTIAMVSCSKGDFYCNGMSGEAGLWSHARAVEAGKAYSVKLALSKLKTGGQEHTGFKFEISQGDGTPNVNLASLKYKVDNSKTWTTPDDFESGKTKYQNYYQKFKKIEFEITFDKSESQEITYVYFELIDVNK